MPEEPFQGDFAYLESENERLREVFKAAERWAETRQREDELALIEAIARASNSDEKQT